MEDSKKPLDKWAPYQFLDKIEGLTELQKSNIATIMENQANYMLSEAAAEQYMEPMPFPIVRMRMGRACLPESEGENKKPSNN